MKRLFVIALCALTVIALAGCSMLYGDMAVQSEAAVAETAETGDAAVTASAQNPGMFSVFQLALALYLIYSAIRGKGRLFENKYTKCDYEKYKRMMRILSILTGVLLSASSLLDMLGVVAPGSLWYWILWAVGFAALIVLMVYNIAMTDRKAAAEAAKQAEVERRKPSNDPLRAAFVFDDDEPQTNESNSDGIISPFEFDGAQDKPDDGAQQ